jgi:hypothetical protein
VFAVKGKIRRIRKKKNCFRLTNRKQKGFEETEKGLQIISVQAEATEGNGNQTEDVIRTYCRGKFSDTQGKI